VPDGEVRQTLAQRRRSQHDPTALVKMAGLRGPPYPDQFATNTRC
jgi:hypothetical protein